jgi:dipeptidyl aminopeptidase/acylaminoacyl peptidase
MSDDRELVERLAAIDATPHAGWVATLRADLDAAWETEDAAGYLDSARRTTVALVDQEPTATESLSGRRWPTLIAVAAVVVVGALVVSVARDTRETQRAGGTPVANGLIAFVGESDDNPATSEIYLVAPDGTGLRPLTATPDLIEYAPAWSPDGSRLAFVRTGGTFSLSSLPCSDDCQLVVVDPATGIETFSADIPQPEGDTWVPRSLTWSPDGRAIVIPSLSCFVGGCGTSVYDTSADTPAEGCDPSGCGGVNSVIADLETGAFTTFIPPYQAGWSRDGEWVSLAQWAIVPGPSVLLVPADRIRAGDVVDIAELPGVRALPEHRDPSGTTVEWMPDGSAMLVSGRASIDVVTIGADQRRTLIEDGFDPVVSPDGSQIAYLRGDGPGLSEIWVAAADGSDPRPVTFSLTPPAWSPDGRLLLAADSQGWFTVRPDGTDRTALGIRDRTPPFPLPGVISSGIDWQPVGAHEQ